MQIIGKFLFLLQRTATVVSRSRFAAILNKPLPSRFIKALDTAVNKVKANDEASSDEDEDEEEVEIHHSHGTMSCMRTVAHLEALRKRGNSDDEDECTKKLKEDHNPYNDLD